MFMLYLYKINILQKYVCVCVFVSCTAQVLIDMSYILSSSDVEDDDDEGTSADIVLACIKRFIA